MVRRFVTSHFEGHKCDFNLFSVLESCTQNFHLICMAKMNSESKKEVEEAKVCQQRPRSTFNCLSFRSFLTFVFHNFTMTIQAHHQSSFSWAAYIYTAFVAHESFYNNKNKVLLLSTFFIMNFQIACHTAVT